MIDEKPSSVLLNRVDQGGAGRSRQRSLDLSAQRSIRVRHGITIDLGWSPLGSTDRANCSPAVGDPVGGPP